jgi:arginine/lysine/ornithine decarboxylase
MLHVQGPRLNRALLRQRLAMVQSSSPSYPMMASLDLARRLLHSRGKGAFTAGLVAVDVLRRGLAELPRYGLVQPAEPLHPNTPPDSLAAYVTQDPFKVVIYDATGVLSGFELQRKLEAKGCVPEMSDDRHVVLLFSLGSKVGDTDHLLQALREIDSEEPSESPNAPDLSGARNISTWNNFHSLQISDPVHFSLKPVSANEIESIDLKHCVGRVAAEMVIPYPPGIPALYPGEVITDQIQRRLAGLAKGGAKFQACADPVLQRIEVYNIQKGGEA